MVEMVVLQREAETHLPELDARDGIPIQMEDIGTSRVWNMRYRSLQIPCSFAFLVLITSYVVLLYFM